MQKLYFFKNKNEDDLWLFNKLKKFYLIEVIEVDLIKQNIDYYINLNLDKNSVIFGHSLSGLVAYLNYSPVKLGIYASPSPLLDGSNSDKVDLMQEYINSENIKKIQSFKYDLSFNRKSIVLFGERESWEDMDKFIFKKVKGAGHSLDEKYKKAIIDMFLLHR